MKYFNFTVLTVILMFVSTFMACQNNQTTETTDEADNYDYDVEEKLTEMGIELGDPTAPIANYVSSVRAGDLVFLSGHGPDKPDGSQIIGKVGEDISIEKAQEAARLTGISLLTSLKANIGDLNKVKQIVKVSGLVNSTADFTKHPTVVNGFSDLMVEVFGERGKHARISVGMGSLPGNIPIEIDMIVEVED